MGLKNTHSSTPGSSTVPEGRPAQGSNEMEVEGPAPQARGQTIGDQDDRVIVLQFLILRIC